MNINAVIGSESHSTSSGWAKLKINGRAVTYRDARTKEFLTKFGDKHAMWVDCTFEVKPGDKISWDAGKNSGNRGSNRERLNLEFIVVESAEIIETPDLGYPAGGAILRGRLYQTADHNAQAAAAHDAARNDL